MASRRIWTIGYAERSLDDLIAALKTARVKHVADVRDLPRSRKKGLSKGPLSTALDAAGIGYSHHGALGAPKALREPFLRGGAFEPFASGYTAHLSRHEDSLLALNTLAREQPTAMLCICHDGTRCHRGIIAGTLKQNGWAVTHL